MKLLQDSIYYEFVKVFIADNFYLSLFENNQNFVHPHFIPLHFDQIYV